MTDEHTNDGREIRIQELVDLLSPGTKLTLVFMSARGNECRRHRIVEYAGRGEVRLATEPPEPESFVTIVFWPGDRVFLLRDGFTLACGDWIGARYLWGHVKASRFKNGVKSLKGFVT